MLEQKQITIDDALNRLSLVAHSLSFLAEQNNGTNLGALLTLLEYRLQECLMALDSPQGR
ncbi:MULTISPECIES: hypothetical protein [unclassified Pseudodesulfovibrio]|uniref:hypothetical protein n=1 Tax=unclassified Pseudodesulfovibrio TaxID=2661612 RepID=UPI000FEBD830|nr:MULTISPECIES: hypothetical protein [unclassified Pseudodesulfovibrio]MCJ2164639.1 hypothetical protein [Pseudodesulfovibrio sp. S3-i]